MHFWAATVLLKSLEVLFKSVVGYDSKSAARSSSQSAMIVIDMVLVQKFTCAILLCPWKKTLYGTFLGLVILASSFKFQSYLYKTKKQNKKM